MHELRPHSTDGGHSGNQYRYGHWNVHMSLWWDLSHDPKKYDNLQEKYLESVDVSKFHVFIKFWVELTLVMHILYDIASLSFVRHACSPPSFTLKFIHKVFFSYFEYMFLLYQHSDFSTIQKQLQIIFPKLLTFKLLDSLYYRQEKRRNKYW